MTVTPIRLFGDPILRTPAVPVHDFDAEFRTLVNDLTETMRAAPGAGLAAPQIGVGPCAHAVRSHWPPHGHPLAGPAGSALVSCTGPGCGAELGDVAVVERGELGVADVVEDGASSPRRGPRPG